MEWTRLVLSIILQYYQQIMAVDPNLGKEMGKNNGDKVNFTGNDEITNGKRIFQITLTFSLMLCSLYTNLYVPLTFIDYVLFTIGTIDVIICFWSYSVLGEFYTFTIGIKSNHKLVTEGPYKYVMHPGYLAQLLLITSTIFFYNVNMFITFCLILYVAYVYTYRIVNEDAMLSYHFGTEYDKYKSSRAKLIPYLF